MSTFGLTWNLKSPDRSKQFISNIPRMQWTIRELTLHGFGCIIVLAKLFRIIIGLGCNRTSLVCHSL